MWTSENRWLKFSGKRSPRLAAAALVLGLALGASVAVAAPAPQSADRAPASAQERGDLRRAIESRYEVLPVSGGVLLKPRQPKAGVRTVEVTGDRIAVNGEAVTSRTLRDWLGADADPVIRLQGLAAADQRQLFGLGDGGSAARTPAAPSEAAPAPDSGDETPATTTDADNDVTETSVEAPATPTPPQTPPGVPEPPRLRSRHGAGSRVNVGGSVTVRKDEVAEEAVAVGGSVEVAGEVNHDVTAIGGPVRIEGTIGGDVISVGGSVYLGPHAVVEGDVTSVGGSIEQDPGAMIHGAKDEVGMMPFFHRGGWRRGPVWNHWGFWGGVSDLMGSLLSLILTGLLVCLVMLVARRAVDRVDRQLVAQPWPSAAAGLAGSIFFWPLLIVVTVLLAITIVGCVLFLLYPFLLLWVVLLLLLGYTAAAYRLGRWLELRFNRNFGGPYATALAGVLALKIWHVLGNLFDLMPGPFGLFGFLVSLFGTLLTMSALIVGFGAVILSRFGLEPGYWPGRGAPPMPPASPAYAGGPVPYPPVEPLPLSQPRWEEPGVHPQAPQEPEPPR
jgi:hypothetical protein